jgi:hypothetical protein
MRILKTLAGRRAFGCWLRARLFMNHRSRCSLASPLRGELVLSVTTVTRGNERRTFLSISPSITERPTLPSSVVLHWAVDRGVDLRPPSPDAQITLNASSRIERMPLPEGIQPRGVVVVAAHHPGTGRRGQIISTFGDSRPPHQCPFSSMAEADVTLNGLGWRMPRMNSFTPYRRSLLAAPRPGQRGLFQC